MKPRLKLQFGWKDVGQMWWLFICLAILCGLVLYVKNTIPPKCSEGTAYDVVTHKCVKIAPEESTVVFDSEEKPIIRVECSKSIENENCKGMVSPECEPECRNGHCTKQKGEGEIIYGNEIEGDSNGEER